jgi:hypothetical protein
MSTHKGPPLHRCSRGAAQRQLLAASKQARSSAYLQVLSSLSNLPKHALADPSERFSLCHSPPVAIALISASGARTSTMMNGNAMTSASRPTMRIAHSLGVIAFVQRAQRHPTPRHPLVLGGSSNQLQKNLGGRNCPRNRRARAQRFETEKASSHGMSAAQTPTEATEAAGPTFPTILHVNLALRAS